MTVLNRQFDDARVGCRPLASRREFVLLVDRAPDAAQARALSPVATVREEYGVRTTRIRFHPPAATLTEAITVGMRAVELLGLRVLRVEADDWVTVADIGRRIGRSRETVRLWASGRLGPGGFPPPVNPRRDTTFFSWAEVVPWLRDRMHLDLTEEEPALAAANLAIQLRALLPRLSQPQALVGVLTRRPHGPRS